MKSLTLLLTTFALSAAASHGATIINATTNNGGHLTGATSATDPGTATSTLAITSNAAGRALIFGGGVGNAISIDGWTMTRVALPGGNNAMGWDAANAVGSEAFQYAFLNRGTATLVSDTVTGTFAAGDVFSLSYLQEMTNGTGTTTATLNFGGGETHTFSSSAASNTANTFSDTYTLLAPSTSVEISLSMVTDNSVGAPQLKVDSFELTAVPEPSSAILALLGGLMVFRRRR